MFQEIFRPTLKRGIHRSQLDGLFRIEPNLAVFVTSVPRMALAIKYPGLSSAAPSGHLARMIHRFSCKILNLGYDKISKLQSPGQGNGDHGTRLPDEPKKFAFQ